MFKVAYVLIYSIKQQQDDNNKDNSLLSRTVRWDGPGLAG